jgi:hypothetical protein
VRVDVVADGYDALVIRVLSVPSGHVYVRHLAPVHGDDAVVRLPDPRVPGDVPAAQWWPPPVLDPAWVREHRDEFDLAHVHFGFDARTADQVKAWVAELRRHDKPLVYTVHDLRNPHHAEPGSHDAALDVLVPAADALVTLTPGVAHEVERRWRRRPLVLPHPHVVPLERVGADRPHREEFVVGVHLKSLRAGMDPVPVVELLAKLVPTLPEARLRLDVHTDVMTPGTPRHDPRVAALLQSVSTQPGVDLAVHDFFTDDELWDYLAGLDLSVLAYRFGTHSGWLEACHDLGTMVLASDCGYYAEQRPCLSFSLTDDGVDGAGLEAAVRLAHDQRLRWQGTRADREREREDLARAHRRVYAEVLR